MKNHKGKKTGSQLGPLLGKLIANTSTYRDEFNKIPIVIYNNKILGYVVYKDEYDDNQQLNKYVNNLKELKEIIKSEKEDEMFNVSFMYNTDIQYPENLIRIIQIKSEEIDNEDNTDEEIIKELKSKLITDGAEKLALKLSEYETKKKMEDEKDSFSTTILPMILLLFIVICTLVSIIQYCKKKKDNMDNNTL